MNDWVVQLLFQSSMIIGLVAWVSKDILWVRIWTVVHLVIYIGFTFVEPTMNVADIAWTVLYIGPNAVWILILLSERRSVVLTGVAKRAYNMCFKGMTERRFLELLKVGEVLKPGSGATLIEKGVPPKHLLLVVDGTVSVILPNDKIVPVGEGKFLGEQSFLTGDVASATVKATGESVIIAWPMESLKQFCKTNEETGQLMQLILTSDVIGKIRAMSKS